MRNMRNVYVVSYDSAQTLKALQQVQSSPALLCTSSQSMLLNKVSDCPQNTSHVHRQTSATFTDKEKGAGSVESNSELILCRCRGLTLTLYCRESNHVIGR